MARASHVNVQRRSDLERLIKRAEWHVAVTMCHPPIGSGYFERDAAAEAIAGDHKLPGCHRIASIGGLIPSLPFDVAADAGLLIL
jgi:hypothetical protein